MEKPRQRTDEEKMAIMIGRFFRQFIIVDTVDDLDMEGVLILSRRRALEAGLEDDGEITDWGDEDLADQVFADGIDPSLN